MGWSQAVWGTLRGRRATTSRWPPLGRGPLAGDQWLEAGRPTPTSPQLLVVGWRLTSGRRPAIGRPG
jgi:hypothetical protein